MAVAASASVGSVHAITIIVRRTAPRIQLRSGKTLIFLTNNTTLPPLTIAALYNQEVGSDT